MLEPESFSVLCHKSDDPLTFEAIYDIPDLISDPAPAGTVFGSVELYDHGFPVGHASVVSRSDYLTSAVTDASGSQAATTPRPGDVSVTAPAGTQRSRTFAGTIIRFLLILLCVAIVCAMIYGVVILISAYRYSKKQGAQLPKKPADDADKPQKSEKGE